MRIAICPCLSPVPPLGLHHRAEAGPAELERRDGAVLGEEDALAQQQKSAGGARHWSEQPAEAAGMWSAAPGPASGSSAVRTRTDKLVFDI